jgi:hypothetical protein
MVIADQVDAQLMETAQLDGSGGSLANVLGQLPQPYDSASHKGVPVTTNSNKIVNPPPRRDWHVVADDLKEEHEPVRRTQLLQELADRIWFEG